MADEAVTELVTDTEDLSQEEEDYINDVVDAFIMAFIGKLAASRAARILHTAITEIPIINDVKKEAGKEPVKVPIGDVRAWAKKEVKAYKKGLELDGGTEVVDDDILTFKPWMKDLKSDLLDDVRKVMKQSKAEGYQPSQLRSELIKAMGSRYNNRLYVTAYCESRRGEDKTKRALYKDTSINYVVWHTQKDIRVRTTHRLREGRIYLVDDCPSLGEPGCRCWIYPYVPKGELMIPAYDKGELPINNPKAIGSYEETLSKRETEKGMIFDKQGYPIYEKEGDRSSVRFTQKEVNTYLEGNIFTHNHPQNTPFSDEDILFGCANNCNEIRACNTTGSYILKNKDGSNLRYDQWEDFNKYNQMSQKYYTDLYGDHYKKKILKGEMTPEEASIKIRHLALAKAAYKVNEIEYKFETR